MRSDVSLMRPCACGGSAAEPNCDCERCRLVWFVLQVKQMRAAQVAFFRAGPHCRPDEKSRLVTEARGLERRIDELVDRFTARPDTQGELFDA